MIKGKKINSFFRNLRYKYRLVVINDDTFEQKTSIKLSKFNLYVATGSFIFLVVLFVTSLIAFTNLKYYLPGVGTIDFRSKINNIAFHTDSLSTELDQRNLWIQNFQNIVSGDLDSSYYFKSDSINSVFNPDSIDLNYLPEADKKLREEVELALEEEELNKKILNNSGSEDAFVFPITTLKLKLNAPINGVLVKDFSIKDEHFGIDIAGDENEPIKAIYDGTVILSEWNPKTGYVIAIQHPNNLISFYKHNSLLLKKIGTFVNKGEAIAVIGNSGEYSSGPHLHLEIWQNGKAQNPTKYIKLDKLN